MLKSTIDITCCGQSLILSNKRVVYWPYKKTLIVSDMHLGKTAHFRKHGIQIPSSVLLEDLQRLDDAIDEFLPERVLVVGDMFHHGYNSDISIFKTWRTRHSSIDLVLVKGNHDRLKAASYTNLGIVTVENEFDEYPFSFVHQYSADADDNVFCVAGHIHPGVCIRGAANQSLRLPCFVMDQKHLVLPAFSKFTGLDTQTYKTNKGFTFFYFTDKSIYRCEC